MHYIVTKIIIIPYASSAHFILNEWNRTGYFPPKEKKSFLEEPEILNGDEMHSCFPKAFNTFFSCKNIFDLASKFYPQMAALISPLKLIIFISQPLFLSLEPVVFPSTNLGGKNQ